MAEELQGETPATTAPEQVEPVEEFDKDRAMATIQKLRQFEKEADKLRKQVSAFEEAEQKRKQAEMSEIDRLKAQYEEATQKAARLERESLQRQAADATGLPLALATRLQGDDLEAMQADAKAILEVMPKGTKQAPNLPTTNPGAGGTPKPTDEERLRRLGLR
jgi:predicted RNase H-like nuclease (RuvC/YqgF family)